MRIRLAALAAALLAGCWDAKLSWFDDRVPWREALPDSAAGLVSDVVAVGDTLFYDLNRQGLYYSVPPAAPLGPWGPSDSGIARIATDGVNVCYQNSGTALRCFPPLSGFTLSNYNAPGLLADSAVAVASSVLYYATATEIRRTPVTAVADTLAAATGSQAAWIGADDANVYWLAGAALFRAPVGGAAAALATPAGEVGWGSVALGATHLYWLERAGGRLAVKRVPKGGAPADAALVAAVEPPRGDGEAAVEGSLALDATHAWFCARFDGSELVAIGRTPLGGGGTEWIAVGPADGALPARCGRIALTPSAVVWGGTFRTPLLWVPR